MASTFLGAKKLIANGLKNNALIFTGYPVVGHQGKMQTSGSCLYSSPIRIDVACAWDPRFNGLFFYESTAMFTTQNFTNFLHDVRELRDLNPNNFCGIDIYNGLLVRFIKASEAYLGQSEDSVVVDFNYYRADDPLTPRLNQDLWEEIEQMAFFKYGARPHWAKNRDLAFADVDEKYPKFKKFIETKNEMILAMCSLVNGQMKLFLVNKVKKGMGVLWKDYVYAQRTGIVVLAKGTLANMGLFIKKLEYVDTHHSIKYAYIYS